MRWIALAGVGLALAGCVEGRVWNTSAINETVAVGSTPYAVAWMRLNSGEIQFIVSRAQALYASDPLTEKANSTTAARQVADRQCGKPASLVVEDRAGSQFHFRYRCA